MLVFDRPKERNSEERMESTMKEPSSTSSSSSSEDTRKRRRYRKQPLQPPPISRFSSSTPLSCDSFPTITHVTPSCFPAPAPPTIVPTNNNTSRLQKGPVSPLNIVIPTSYTTTAVAVNEEKNFSSRHEEEKNFSSRHEEEKNFSSRHEEEKNLAVAPPSVTVEQDHSFHRKTTGAERMVPTTELLLSPQKNTSSAQNTSSGGGGKERWMNSLHTTHERGDLEKNSTFPSQERKSLIPTMREKHFSSPPILSAPSPLPQTAAGKRYSLPLDTLQPIPPLPSSSNRRAENASSFPRHSAPHPPPTRDAARERSFSMSENKERASSARNFSQNKERSCDFPPQGYGYYPYPPPFPYPPQYSPHSYPPAHPYPHYPPPPYPSNPHPHHYPPPPNYFYHAPYPGGDYGQNGVDHGRNRGEYGRNEGGGGEYHGRSHRPNYSLMSAKELDDRRKRFVEKYSILQQKFPQWRVELPSQRASLDEIHEQYELYVNKINGHMNSWKPKLILIFSVCILEFLVTRFTKLDVKGYAKNQINSMHRYESVLLELGEKWSSPGGGTPWSPESRILSIVVSQAIVFFIAKCVSKWTGSVYISKMIQDTFDGLMAGSEDGATGLDADGIPILAGTEAEIASLENGEKEEEILSRESLSKAPEDRAHSSSEGCIPSRAGSVPGTRKPPVVAAPPSFDFSSMLGNMLGGGSPLGGGGGMDMMKLVGNAISMFTDKKNASTSFSPPLSSSTASEKPVAVPPKTSPRRTPVFTD